MSPIFVIAAAAIYAAAAYSEASATVTAISERQEGVREFIVDMNGHLTQAPAYAGPDEESVLTFRYCGDPVTGLATGDSDDVENSAAILLPGSLTERYAGTEVMSVVICRGFNVSNWRVNNVTDATVFLSHDIFNDEPFMTQRGRLSKTSMTWSEIKFENPYVLEAGKPLYIGYKVTRPTNDDCVFVADRIKVDNDCSFWVNYSLDGERKWENWAPIYGSLCIQVRLRGEALPVNDVEIVSGRIPAQVPKGDFNTSFTIRNIGVNPLTSVGYVCKVGDNEVEKEYSFPTPIEFSETATITETLVCQDYGIDIPVGITVTSVNGEPDIDMSNNITEGLTLCLDPAQGYDRSMVMEEGTGLWCGNCPRGIASMEYMKEKYPDRFIGIGAHYNDIMQITDEEHSYKKQFEMYSNFPHARFNRNDEIYGVSIFDFGPFVESVFLSETSMPSMAGMTMQLYYTDETKSEINVETQTEFAFDNDKPFRISLVLLENGVGPYAQSNGYAGSSSDCGGWENRDANAVYMFDDVARYVDDYLGVENSLPTVKNAKVSYGYNAILPVAPLASKEDFDVVAMLVNSETGVIENAVSCHGGEHLAIKEFSQVEDLTSDGVMRASASGVPGGVLINGSYDRIEICRTAGMAVTYKGAGAFIALPEGIYIVRIDGGRPAKILVR